MLEWSLVVQRVRSLVVQRVVRSVVEMADCLAEQKALRKERCLASQSVDLRAARLAVLTAV